MFLLSGDHGSDWFSPMSRVTSEAIYSRMSWLSCSRACKDFGPLSDQNCRAILLWGLHHIWNYMKIWLWGPSRCNKWIMLHSVMRGLLNLEMNKQKTFIFKGQRIWAHRPAWHLALSLTFNLYDLWQVYTKINVLEECHYYQAGKHWTPKLLSPLRVPKIRHLDYLSPVKEVESTLFPIDKAVCWKASYSRKPIPHFQSSLLCYKSSLYHWLPFLILH